MIGKPVYFLDIYDLKRFPDSLKTPIGYVGYRYDSAFLSFQTIQISLAPKTIQPADSLRINWFTGGYRPFAAEFLRRVNKPYKVFLIFFKGRNVFAEKELALDLSKAAMKSHISAVVYPALPKGKYKMMLSIVVPGYNPTHNSEKIKLTVK